MALPNLEFLLIGGRHVPHTIVEMEKDGACLFHSIAHLSYGTSVLDDGVRSDIVGWMSLHWEQYGCMTDMGNGHPFPSVEEYQRVMLLSTTYGSNVEMKAASMLYNRHFEVYRDLTLYTFVTCDSDGCDCAVSRLRFTGPLSSGHFDVYEEYKEKESEVDVFDSIGLCEPKRAKRGRPKTSLLTRPEQIRAAAKRYSSENADLKRKAVSKCIAGNRDAHRTRVATYSANNPHVNRQAVKVYTSNNPDVHRQAVARYDTKNSRTSRRHKKWVNQENSGFKYDPTVDYRGDKSVNIGKMDKECPFCNCFKWSGETKGFCCSNGKVYLDPITRPPEPIWSLLTGSHEKSKDFKDKQRCYNQAFQMTSFKGGVHIDGYAPTFKVQGQVYHRIGNPFATVQDDAKFLQIYFVGDSAKEAALRHKNFPKTDGDLIREIQDLLHTHNPYVRDFKAAKATIKGKGDDYRLVIYADRKPNPNDHVGRYNAPSTDEIAIVLVNQQFQKRDIVLCTRDDKLKRISEMNRAYDALQYPLMFCRGEDGYSVYIKQQTGNKTVTCSQFYAYRIMVRKGEDNPLHYYGPLLQQYFTDMYAKIETERLNFIRYNQQKLRVDEYCNLQDAMLGDGNADNIGKLVVLPSSFTGSPRYMQERAQDAMTYVRLYGRPDLFITLTCSPNWPEIKEALLPGQKADDRPDIVARVFYLKLKVLRDKVVKSKLFGPVKCYIISQEWQKRGLPHAHCLFWLENKAQADKIDVTVRAEIPDVNVDPDLHDIVTKSMIHGPCGRYNPSSACMKNGKCSKNFPKPFMQQTKTGDDGYPKYRRRSPVDGGHTFDKKLGDFTMTVDNSWVVPYNPVLSALFGAHINVEFCNSVKCIQYVCKYVCKGTDQLTFAVVNEKDEISNYQSGRYISSSEAVHRTLGLPVHHRFPAVIHLAVHLENGQRVYFRGDEPVAVPNEPPATTLTAFFDLCSKDDFAATLLYYEVVNYYVWNQQKKNWGRRKQGQDVVGHPGVKREHVVGRVYVVHPSNAECFYLRILLHEVRGPKSFQHIRTVNGQVHSTFQSTCLALGLLENDNQWEMTLQQCELTKSPAHLRQLFVIILIFCQVADPRSLLAMFHAAMAGDILTRCQKRFNDFTIKINGDMLNECLCLIEDLVQSYGKELSDFNIDAPSRTSAGRVNKDYLRETSYDVAKLRNDIICNEPKLNPEQLHVYNTIMNSINETTPKNSFFLDAPGGTGKTFLINLLLAKVRVEGKVALAAASTGIAATLLDGGRTAHSTFKLPIDTNFAEIPLCNISRSSAAARLLRECSLIVWDESCMSNKRDIEALNNTLQDIRKSNALMGGVTVLFAGDFRQVLPVVSKGTRADEVAACLKSSHLWPYLKILTLRTNMRVHITGDPGALRFANILRTIGDGKMPEVDGLISLDSNLCRHVTTINDLINEIYPDIKDLARKPVAWLTERAILTPKNLTAYDINDELMKKFDAFEMNYNSIDTVVNSDDAVNYPIEFLNSLNPSGMPGHILNLKIGAPIMLLRNLDPPRLCNGTRLQVKGLRRNVIEAVIITGPSSGETFFIPRIPLLSTTDYPFHFRRLQFPVKVCFAMTVNKAQGQSFKHTGVDLREDCFSHGQFYVACSRASNAENLIVLSPTGKVKNVIYREVL